MKIVQMFTMALLILLFCGVVSAQSVGDPVYTNQLLSDFQTPTMEPGQTDVFSFTIINPYANWTTDMRNVRLNVSIYQYGTLDESMMVSEIENPPIILEADDVEHLIQIGDMPPGTRQDVSFTIVTEGSTPHGSYFSQSTYFVRFWLEFELDGENHTMVSRGYFNDEQWANLTDIETSAGGIDLDYLGALGFDAIIPDSSFAVKPHEGRPLPLWPFWLLLAVVIFIGILAAGLFVLDNPGMCPKLERRLLRLNGKLAQLKLALFRKKD